MQDILCGILNYGRTHKDMKKVPNKIKGDVVICTDNPEFWGKRETIAAEESVAASKNKIIDLAIERGYKYVFIIEDDIIPKNKSLFLEYKQMMQKYDLCGIMYGYDTPMNKVFGKRPNASLIITDHQGHIVNINRYPCSSFIGLKVKPDMVKFDEQLCILETDFLFIDMHKKGDHPFNGFFFDISKSWEKFKKIDVKSIRKKNLNMINKDREVRKKCEIKPDFSADAVLKYMNEHR